MRIQMYLVSVLSNTQNCKTLSFFFLLLLLRHIKHPLRAEYICVFFCDIQQRMFSSFVSNYFYSALLLKTHQWPRDYAFTIGRPGVPGSIFGRAYRTRRSEISVVFSKTRVNTVQNPLKRPSLRAFCSQAQVHCKIIGLNPTTNEST